MPDREQKTNFSAPEASYKPEEVLHPLVDPSSEVVVDFGTITEKPKVVLDRLGILPVQESPRIKLGQSGSKYEESRKTPQEREAILIRQKKQGVRVPQKASVYTWLKEQESQGLFMTPADTENLEDDNFFSLEEESEAHASDFDTENEQEDVESVLTAGDEVAASAVSDAGSESYSLAQPALNTSPVNITPEIQAGSIFEPDDDEKHITAEELSRDFDEFEEEDSDQEDFEEHLDDGLYFQDSGVVAKPHSISAEDTAGFHTETPEDLDPEKEHILFERDSYAFHDHSDEIFVPENPPMPEEDPAVDHLLITEGANLDPLKWKLQCDSLSVIVETNGNLDTKYSLEEDYSQESDA